MNLLSNKSAGILFGVASLLMFIMILLYFFVYQPPVGEWQVRLQYMQDHWNLIATIWRIEFLTAVIIAWVAFSLAHHTPWWYLVAIGHLLMLVEYLLMLGGYPAATTREAFQVINEMALWAFAAANCLWTLGMAGVYFGTAGWLRYAGAGLAFIAGVLFGGIVLGLTTVESIMVVGPMIILLYVLNVYFGIRFLVMRNDPAKYSF